jgi:hypothetical protein
MLTINNFYESLTSLQKSNVDKKVLTILSKKDNKQSRESLQEQISKEMYRIIQG